jgi:hypothetical protein
MYRIHTHTPSYLLPLHTENYIMMVHLLFVYCQNEFTNNSPHKAVNSFP